MSLYKARLYPKLLISMKTIKRHGIQMSYSVLLSKKKKCRVAVPVIHKCSPVDYNSHYYLSVEPYITEYNRNTGKFFAYFQYERRSMVARLFV